MADTNGSNNAEDASRGRPYYEKLRSDLKATLDKKREIDKNLARLEENIAASESAYLEDTAAAGNIIRGFDNYIKASSTTTTTTTGGGTSTRRKGGITEQDRIFSRSSVSWTNRDNMNNLSLPPSEAATPARRETPVASGPTKNKKKKAVVDKDDEDSERPTKRGKVTWGRD